jgi:transcription elongation factor Elf1
MGSVQSDVECPQCKNPNAMEDLYYKSNEVYVFCDNCGYHYERTIRRDEDWDLVLRCPECEHEGVSKRKGNIVVKGLNKKNIDKIKGYTKKNNITFTQDGDSISFIHEDFKAKDNKLFLLHFLKNEKIKYDDNIQQYCSNCDYQFDNIWNVIIYDEIEQRGKGSLTIAGIIFTCPACGQDSCPDFKDDVYYCKNRDCGKPFDKKTADEMIKRKQISGIHSVSQIPDTMTDKQVQEWLKEVEETENVVIVNKQLWNEGD